jgi:ribosomal protein S18 acetylase RimI-like enzyme
MKSQLYIKSVDNSFFNRPNLGLFIKIIFENFMELYDFPQLNHNRNEILRLLNSQKFHGFLVFYGNKLIGYLLGELLDYNGMYLYFINYLYVSPVFRDKKLGSQLMNLAKEYAIMQNTDGVSLISDTENDKNFYFYQKLGFKIHEDRLYQRHELFIWNKQ